MFSISSDMTVKSVRLQKYTARYKTEAKILESKDCEASQALQIPVYPPIRPSNFQLLFTVSAPTYKNYT